jgi:ABC-type nitrate/sulfonate/bicarbonate transport system substrate-binding protein
LDKINIQFTLFSAFYSPLISAMSGGFLGAEGLDPEWSISPPGVSALAALKDGSAHVVLRPGLYGAAGDRLTTAALYTEEPLPRTRSTICGAMPR